MWWMMGDNFPAWWMLIGMAWSVIFWGGIVLLAVWGIRALGRRQQVPGHPDPLAVVKERYARGEITREQYQEMRSDLER